MSSQKTLLLDLDGMLIDMVVPLMQWWGVRIHSEEQYPQQFGWDVKSAIAHLLEQQDRPCKADDIRNLSKEVFWRRPQYVFWRDLQPYPTAFDFVKFLESGPFDIYILTAHASAQCAAAKLDWIAEHLPKYRDRVLLGRPKHLAATPQSILIDDCTKNCEDFARAGGRAIQCPRPWNERWNAPECFRQRPVSGLERRPEYNIITQDLHDILGQL
jgi:5'(3')-deoxyribonucleotidase